MAAEQSMFSSTGRMSAPARYIAPLLDDIAAQAANADSTRSIAPDVIAAIKKNDIMRMSASPELGGLDESMVAIANELRDIAARCTSTSWCMWNHLCTFQHFAGLLGPQNIDFLKPLVAAHEWVCFPAGATSKVDSAIDGEMTVLSGVAAFGSGGRYAEWAGVVFNEDGAATPQFAMADLRHANARIDPTWDAMSLRASATDHIYYDGVPVPSSRIVPWPPKYREPFRSADHPMINQRYREDWVALSVMWLGAMATGVAEISFNETAQSIRERIAIFGTKMIERPTIHVNLGRAQALISAATDTVYAALGETDARIAAGVMPVEGDYDRITEQLGRISLGLDSQNPF